MEIGKKMKGSSKNISDDSISGMIFAVEGIKDAVTLLNGPMGCKFYHSTTSQFLDIRPRLYITSENGEKGPVDLDFLNNWFFRQPRVPCTYMDSYDYVYGTAGKVEEGLKYLKENLDFSLLTIVNSPGASLIGDNLSEIAESVIDDRPVIVLESPGFSQDAAAGYATAVTELVRQLDIKKSPKSGGGKRINIIGLSIWDRYYTGDKKELKKIFDMCGIETGCFLCAGSTVDEILRLGDADLNLVIDVEKGGACGRLLEEKTGVPSYYCERLPIGFDATEKMVKDVCRILDAPTDSFMEASKKARAVCWYNINNIYETSGLPKFVPFAVCAGASRAYAYTAFLTEYLGMVPDCVSVRSSGDPSVIIKLEDLLRGSGDQGALSKAPEDTKAELVFADANVIAMLKTMNRVFCGIEISLPGMGYTDIIPKTHFGIKGAMFLTEQVLNGLMSRL